MKTQHRTRFFGIAGIAIASALLASTQALALDQIIRPFQSVRAAGMGNVRYSTGLYEENFFANPARVLNNPTWRFQLPLNLMGEIDTTALENANSLTGSGDTISKISNTTGKNNHIRIQYMFPGIYIPVKSIKMSFALGMVTSIQADVDIRKSYNIDPTAVADVTPAFTIGRTFLEDDSLGVGLTAKGGFRLSSAAGFSLLKLVQGASASPAQSGGAGAGYDFDIGATYIVPYKILDVIEIQPVLTINNILGGKFTNIKSKPISALSDPPLPQDRMLALGASLRYPEVLVFKDTMLALEFTDIGHNKNGSLWRTVHIGAETRIVGFVLPRVGINQGYFCAGLGLDLRLLTLDAATYAEEMSLNPGGLPDRRYAVQVSFQI